MPIPQGNKEKHYEYLGQKDGYPAKAPYYAVHYQALKHPVGHACAERLSRPGENTLYGIHERTGPFIDRLEHQVHYKKKEGQAEIAAAEHPVHPVG